MRKVKCQLNEPPFYQCCCVCESNLTVMNDYKKTGEYVCIVFYEMEKENSKNAYAIKNTKHSCGCEMWHDIRKG